MDKRKRENNALDGKRWLETFRMASAIILLSLSVYFTSVERGFISTLPIFILAVITVSFFYDELIINAVFVGISSVIFSLSDFGELKYCLIYTILMLVAFLVITFSARLLKTAISSQASRAKFSFFIAFFILLLIPIFSQFYVFGNPISNINKNSEINQYLSEKYPNKKFEDISTYYDFSKKEYISRVYFNDTDATLFRELYNTPDGLKDGYFDFLCESSLENRKNALIDLIRKTFSDKMNIRAAGIALEADSEQTITLTYKGDNSNFYNLMSFDISFEFMTTQKRVFAEYCTVYAKYFKENGFVFKKIKFYGGDVNTYMFEYTLTPESNLENISNEVSDFNPDTYVSYE